MASARWRLSFHVSNSPGTKMIEENIDTVRNLVEEKPNSSISLPTPFQS